MKTRIYVNRHKIASNKKTRAKEPPISIRTYKETRYANQIELNNTWTLKYDPENALCSGATVWLEGEHTDVRIIE